MRRLFSIGTISARWISAKVLNDFLILLTTVLIIDRVAFIIGSVVIGKITRNELYSTVIIMIFALICRMVLSWSSSSIAFRISANIKLKTRDRIYSKLLDIEFDYRDANKTGALVTTTVEGVEALGVFYSKFVPQIFLSILIPATLYFYLSYYTQQIAIIMILSVPLIPISVFLVQKWVKRVAKIHWNTYEDLNAFFLDSIQGIKTLKLLGLISDRTDKIAQKSWDFRNKTMKLLYVNLTSILVMDLIALMGTALGITCAVLAFESGMISLTVSIVVLLIAYEFYRPLRLLGSFFHFAMQGISASKSILEILDYDEFEDKTEGERFVPGINHDIEFKNVCYSYNTKNSDILKDVNFISKTGKITGIVGQSGSGKTTIVDLITKLYNPQSGQILIGNRDITTINRKELRNHISIIPQRPFLFHGSIKDNLLIAKSSASDNELLEACEKAGILEFIHSLPKGLDSCLTEQASNISEGQIQRIAIARALVKDSPILILDEPTSNVDAENEVTILKTLKQISKTKTTILITHRLSTILDSDNIIVIDNGVTVDEGRHDELINRGGFYAELFQNQVVNDPLFENRSNFIGNKESKMVTVTENKAPLLVEPTNNFSRYQLVRRLLGTISPVQSNMTIAIILGTLNHLANIALVVWGSYLVSSIFIDEIRSINLLDILLLFLLAIIKVLSSYIEQNKNHDVAFRLLAILRTKLYKQLEPLAPAKLIYKRSGDIGSTIGSDIELIEVFFAHTISPVSIAFIVSTTILVFLGTFWIILPLVLLPFFIFLGIILPIIWDGFQSGSGNQIRNEIGETNAYLTDSLQGLKTILQFNQGESRRRGIAERGLKINHHNQKYASREGLLFGLVGGIVFLANIIMIIIATEGFFSEILSTQDYIIVIILSMSSFGPIIAVSMVAHHLSQTFAAAQRLFTIIDEDPAIVEKLNCSSTLPDRFDIEFKNVCFSYSKNSPPILKNFNFQVPQNTNIALLGSSGNGKSTVLKLLLRFWEIDSGKITIGGINIKSICLKDLYNMISVVDQDSHLFDTTFRENIAIGNPSADLNEIIQSAKNTHIHDFIMSLPKGYDTSIGERGEKLSGGERQRIIIARALLKDAPILLLDEPTSFLDSINENAIQKLLNDISKDRILILITHRLSSYAKIDKTYIMNEGKCQEIIGY